MRRLGADLGLPSNDRFDISLAIFTHVGAAAPGNPSLSIPTGFGRRAIVA
ncbi:hypothetical protein ACULNC_11620 [Shigella flexneri]